MSERTSRRRRKNPAAGIIHLLNQRYREQWERAERLQRQLDRLRWSPLAALLGVLRRVKHWLKPPTEPPLAERAVPYIAPCVAAPTRRVSIIIPFRDRPELLRNCLRSLGVSTHRRFEIVLVDNGSIDPRTRRLLARVSRRPNVRIVEDAGPFNFSRLCNTGAQAARGEHLLFLNNDTEALTHDWLEHLLTLAGDPRVGIVGATLLYPDHTIQHAGLLPRTDGVWVHPYRGQPANEPGENGELQIPRSVPAVTAACLLMRREVFEVLGGFDERFPVTFNDVDLCTRVRERGLLVVISPHAQLLHYESLSRGCTADAPKR